MTSANHDSSVNTPTIDVPESWLWYPVLPRTKAFDFRKHGWLGYGAREVFVPREVYVNAFAMDRYEVTNEDYEGFLRATGYRPEDEHNFLRHWRGDSCPEQLARHPVVWVSLDDARAYATWAEKRLPTEVEWQLAAQGTDARAWPWGPEFEPWRCNAPGTGTTPVDAFPRGASVYGVEDLVGNVWEYTDSEEFDGAHRSCNLRGGSYFNRLNDSHWYGPSGPLEVYHHRKLMLVSDSYHRSGTVGFRCCRS
jgi:formylglycine-generating enzyme required for sulfatase activity